MVVVGAYTFLDALCILGKANVVRSPLTFRE